MLKQMRLYPAILILTWTFGTINRIVQAAGKDVFGLVCSFFPIEMVKLRPFLEAYTRS